MKSRYSRSKITDISPLSHTQKGINIDTNVNNKKLISSKRDSNGFEEIMYLTKDSMMKRSGVLQRRLKGI